MKIQPPRQHYQCAAIVQPGEYTIDRWDNKQCEETNPYHLIRCEGCGNSYCTYHHWQAHKCNACPVCKAPLKADDCDVSSHGIGCDCRDGVLYCATPNCAYNSRPVNERHA